MPSEFKNDQYVVLAAITQKEESLYFASEQIKRDRNIALSLIYSSKGECLKYVSDVLKKDHEIVLKAVSKNLDSLKYVDPSVLDDDEFIIQII